jgi:uncharacterized protein
LTLPLPTEPIPEAASAPISSVQLSPPQIFYLEQARQSLDRLLDWHRQHDRFSQGEFQPQLEALERLSSQLNRGILRIAVFGLVSRGKSAVLNALLGQKIFPTGPLHGVTQWPRSGLWQLEHPEPAIAPLQIEFIDTPGLEEIDGQQRAEMAETIGQEVELILFVTTGEPTTADISALQTICGWQTPLLLVVNKADLYPSLTPETLYQKLSHPIIQQRLSVDEIIFTAAAPAPVPVRLQWPSGRTSDRWEVPPPNIDPLKQKLLHLLSQEGAMLLAYRTLTLAQSIEIAIAEKIVADHRQSAQALLWKFIAGKGLAVALNPLGFWDVGLGLIADLLLIRSLSRLYGLPMTRHGAGKLWQTLLSSAGGLLLGQLLGGWVFAEGAESGGLTHFLGSAIADLTLAGYGALIVSRHTQAYITAGCTWGPLGCSTLLQSMVEHLHPPLLLYRLRQHLDPLLPDRAPGN